MSDIADAIRCIPADDRDIWVKVGMSVKAELGNDGFDLWDSWSQTAANYQERSARDVWRSIKTSGGITARSLFRLARQYGWSGAKDQRTDEEKKAARERARLKARRIAQEERQSEMRAQKAAQKAARMLSECVMGEHDYFESKGFPEHRANIWTDGNILIPMRRGWEIVGCQMINAGGEKKFLYGQRSGGAEFVMGQRGKHFLCEGYATALSAQVVLRNLKTPYVLHVCFSAGNMKKIAQGLPGGVVLADHDASGTGERVAREIGWPYWMSDTVGEDFNDAHQRLGTFAMAMQLRRVLTAR